MLCGLPCTSALQPSGPCETEFDHDHSDDHHDHSNDHHDHHHRNHGHHDHDHYNPHNCHHHDLKIVIFRLIPAANMGEYEPPRERPEDGGLYPLNAEVTNTLMMVMMSKDDHDNLMKIMTIW